jgi:flagellar hook protein FlgE
MLRSLYSGISGMKVNQTKLDVIGNNIANVGTTSFKNARVRFQDMLSQNVSQALAPGVNQGGVNPRQVGLGVQMAGIDTIVSQGMMQPTSRNLDVAVDGDGYFMVGSGQLPFDNNGAITLNGSEVLDTNGMGLNYTRDGSFTLDKSGNLLTSDGYRVLGYAAAINGGRSSVTYADGKLDSVNYVNVNDLSIRAEGTLVPLVIPDSVKRPASSFASKVDMPISSGNIDNAASPSIQGNYIGQTAIVEVKYTASPSGYVYSVNGETKGALPTKDLSGNDVYTTTFDGITIEVPKTNQPISDALWTQNLYAEGEPVRITTFNIGKDGVISAVLDDGSVSALGQIAMASFKNPAGLTKLGRNLYEKSANSGEAIVRSGMASARDNSAGYGDMLQGMLEMSNVDLAEQFTDMIVTSRAFQANSKTITTGDEILQEILNLKR